MSAMTREDRMREALKKSAQYIQNKLDHLSEVPYRGFSDEEYLLKSIDEALSAAPEAPHVGDVNAVESGREVDIDVGVTAMYQADPRHDGYPFEAQCSHNRGIWLRQIRAVAAVWSLKPKESRS